MRSFKRPALGENYGSCKACKCSLTPPSSVGATYIKKWNCWPAIARLTTLRVITAEHALVKARQTFFRLSTNRLLHWQRTKNPDCACSRRPPHNTTRVSFFAKRCNDVGTAREIALRNGCEQNERDKGCKSHNVIDRCSTRRAAAHLLGPVLGVNWHCMSHGWDRSERHATVIDRWWYRPSLVESWQESVAFVGL